MFGKICNIFKAHFKNETEVAYRFIYKKNLKKGEREQSIYAKSVNRYDFLMS